ncbi:hypothetical protein TIFTF001_020845 [Ficus carica]|uniref:Uncharacterized protein n=1 Tax=Ficus carica TaxID=3494 RepID=A0AA88ABJ1_FICCA|nr:hypothetical protein TIFTF001_020845 [Ficus carica]
MTSTSPWLAGHSNLYPYIFLACSAHFHNSSDSVLRGGFISSSVFSLESHFTENFETGQELRLAGLFVIVFDGPVEVNGIGGMVRSSSPSRI